MFGLNNYNISDHALPAKTGLTELLSVPAPQLAAELAILLPNISNGTAIGTVQRILALASSYTQLALVSLSDPAVVAVGNSLLCSCDIHH